MKPSVRPIEKSHMVLISWRPRRAHI